MLVSQDRVRDHLHKTRIAFQRTAWQKSLFGYRGQFLECDVLGGPEARKPPHSFQVPGWHTQDLFILHRRTPSRAFR
jgi:hypothetical protein